MLFSPQKNIHAILLEELEAESKHWISTPEDITAKITDDIWEVPGNNSAGGQITMPDEHLWRFSADVGLYNQEEEVRSACYCARKACGDLSFCCGLTTVSLIVRMFVFAMRQVSCDEACRVSRTEASALQTAGRTRRWTAREKATVLRMSYPIFLPLAPTLSLFTQPSERNAYLRSRMYSRMKEMHTAQTYVRERRTRWDNDTRGLLKEADRLLRKKRPAPPGYMARLESSGAANRWKSIHENADE